MPSVETAKHPWTKGRGSFYVHFGKNARGGGYLEDDTVGGQCAMVGKGRSKGGAKG